MPSRRAKLIRQVLTVANRVKRLDYRHILKRRRLNRFSLNSALKLTRNSQAKWVDIGGARVLSIGASNDFTRTIIYLHGGGFVYGLSAIHLMFIKKLAKLCHAQILAIDYLLAPENRYPLALDQIQSIYKQIISGGDTSNLAIVGDSAGASLAMALCLKNRDENIPNPACLVMISPSFDAKFIGKSHAENEGKDPILNLAKMRFFIDNYVGDCNKDDPYISAINANLHHLPPALILCGSDEIMLSDSEKLVANAKRDNAKFELVAGDDMWHNYPLSAGFMPESSHAIKIVARFIINQIKN